MGFVSLAACSPAGIAEQPSIPQAQMERALAIAGAYKAYGRVDDELRWAPGLCRQPLPGTAHPSASTDPATHGQKLYSVFVKDHAAYPAASPVGQVVVKESFLAELITDPHATFAPTAPYGMITDDHFYPYARKDGNIYRVGAPAGLYIMYRVDPSVAGTDDGWIYTTVSPAEKVTASGHLDSCVGCHQAAPNGRLFGVPTSPQG